MPAGPFAMLLGYVLMGTIPVLLRFATEAGVGSATAVAARFAVGSLLIGVMVGSGRFRVRTANKRALLLRGVLGGVAVLLYFAAVARTSAAMGTLLNTTHSLWSTVLAIPLLGDRPGRSLPVQLVLAAVGLWLVIQPTMAGVGLGELLGLLSGVVGGAAVLTIKELRRTDDALTILSSFSLVGFVVSLPLLPFDPAPPRSAVAWGALLLLGFTSFFGQLAFNHGYKGTSVRLGSVLSLTTPIVAGVLGALLLGEPPSARFMLGSALVLAACVLAAVAERHAKRAAQASLSDVEPH